MVRLTNRSDRYDYTAPASMRVGADSVTFRRLCTGVPPGIPAKILVGAVDDVDNASTHSLSMLHDRRSS